MFLYVCLTMHNEKVKLTAVPNLRRVYFVFYQAFDRLKDYNRRGIETIKH